MIIYKRLQLPVKYTRKYWVLKKHTRITKTSDDEFVELAFATDHSLVYPQLMQPHPETFKRIYTQNKVAFQTA